MLRVTLRNVGDQLSSLNNRLLVLACVTMLLYGCQTAYPIRRVKGDATTLTALPWERAKTWDQFSDPWSELPNVNTTFRALHDAEWIYFMYECEDEQIVMHTAPDPEEAAVRSDRVELFIAADDQLQRYYTFELDASGRMFDAEAEYYRKVDAGWNLPTTAYQIQAKRTKTGYRVWFALSQKALKSLDLLRENQLTAAVLRADYHPERPTQWITWKDPQLPKPDFHTPEVFGVFYLK